MRLTLRTMLAYLDDVLDPPDAHELEQKIEESRFASGLVHRIRDSMRRLRLGTPDLDGEGVGVDPNSVAEYLDSTLEPEQVPEFERVCLEHDTHLAEVASCHQVLTLVLGEPAEVNPGLREAVYRIGQTPQAAATSTRAGESGNGYTIIDEDLSDQALPVGATVTPAGDAIATEYKQRTSQIPIKSLAITLLLGFLIALAAIQAIGVDNLMSLFGMGASTEVVEQPVEPVGESPAAPANARPQPGVNSGELSGGPGAAAVEPEDARDATAGEGLASEDASPTPLSPPVESHAAGGNVAGGNVAERNVAESNADVVERPQMSNAPPVPAAAPPTSDPEPPATGDEPANPAAAPPVSSDAAAAPGESPAVGAVAEAPRRTQAGRYISEQQVLARFDVDRGAWFRLPPDSPLTSGDRFVSLPTYRPQLLLSPGVKITLSDETHVQVQAATEDAGPTLMLEMGRAIIVPVGEPGISLQLDFGGRRGTALFADADSVMALEMRRYLPPGGDVDLTPPAVVVEMFALSGQIGWREGDAEPTLIDAGQVLAFVADEAVEMYEAPELPTWVDGRHLMAIDPSSSRELRGYLSVDRPLSLSLMERVEFRKVEVRSLAARALCCLDVFEPSIKALNDDSQHSYWGRHCDALRTSLARSPTSAAKLRRTLEQLNADDADLMQRLLAGFSPMQLKSGGAERLVDALEHPQMSVRVLAYENLERITGKTQLFRPEQPPAKEKNKIMKWRRNLEEGLIVYQHPPRPLAERPAVAASEVATETSE